MTQETWTEKCNLRPERIKELRKVWKQARQDSRPGVPVDKVLDKLERKYQALSAADNGA